MDPFIISDIITDIISVHCDIMVGEVEIWFDIDQLYITAIISW